MRFEEGLLAYIKIESSSEYKSKSKTSTSFMLSLYISSPLIPLLPSSLTSINSPSSYNNNIMSQYNLYQIIK